MTQQEFQELVLNKLENLEKGQTEVKAEVKELKAEVKEIKAGQARLEAQITALKAEVTALKVEVKEIKVEINILKAEVKKLKAGQARLEARLEALHSELIDKVVGLKIEIMHIGDQLDKHEVNIKTNRRATHMALNSLLLQVEDIEDEVEKLKLKAS